MFHSEKLKLASANNQYIDACVLFSGEESYKIGLFQEKEININGCGFLLPNNYSIEGMSFYVSSVKEIESLSDMKIKIQLYTAEKGNQYIPIEHARIEMNLGKKFLRTDFREKSIKIDYLTLSRLNKLIVVVSFYSKEEKEEEFFVGGTLYLKDKNDAF